MRFLRTVEIAAAIFLVLAVLSTFLIDPNSVINYSGPRSFAEPVLAVVVLLSAARREGLA